MAPSKILLIAHKKHKKNEIFIFIIAVLRSKVKHNLSTGIVLPTYLDIKYQVPALP